MTTTIHEGAPDTPSLLARLRALAPTRALTLFEALRLAELQANRLLEISGIADLPVPSEIVTGLPRICVEYDFDMPDHAAGASDWDTPRKTWVITLNPTHPDTRQHFTLLHEYKHILDHGQPGLRPDIRGRYYGLTPSEYVADYFAGCALMPKRLVKRAWGQGVQRPNDLALLFDVSKAAICVRLRQIGLTEPAQRCAPSPAAKHAHPRTNPRYRGRSTPRESGVAA
jgi:Zn-dependent peptidase ImmA (M78 family)